MMIGLFGFFLGATFGCGCIALKKERNPLTWYGFAVSLAGFALYYVLLANGHIH